jgi:CRISPR-associated protein Csx17
MNVPFQRHLLAGCAPAPLANYLKALGILRLVGEQKDPSCRGAWRDDRFILVTLLTRDEVERFLLQEYQPTAIIDPWNGGSGFFPKDNSKGIEALLGSTDPRLKPIQAAIEWARQAVAGWKEAPKDDAKSDFQSTCLAHLRGGAAEAMHAAVVMTPQVQQGRMGNKTAYPALLGTGWNDGRLDFANNFHQRLADLFDLARKPGASPDKEQALASRAQAENRDLLRLALWADPGMGLRKSAIGQFAPGSAGGPNSTTGPDGDSSVNPWDFVLMMEGAVLFTTAATRRMDPTAQVQASAPFALHSHAVGGDPISDVEESQRGEQWMPLWDRLFALDEVRSLLWEGRAQIGRTTVARPVDMARAISRLGVARGITQFQRFAFLERNGQANFAVPLDRIRVTARPDSRLIDDLAPWLDRLHRLVRDKAPARLIQAERQLSDAVFDVLTHDPTPSRWQAVLRAASGIEKLQVAGTGIEVGPIPRLSSEWVMACLGPDPGPTERLAAALGGAAGGYTNSGRPFDGVRHHWLPLKPGARQFATTDQGRRLSHDVRVVAQGRDPETDLLAVLERRTLEAASRDGRHPRVVSAPGTAARPADLNAWLAGDLDPSQCLDLARAFMAVDWPEWVRRGMRLPASRSRAFPEDGWCLLRLNALPWKLDAGQDIPLDPAIIRHLGSGRLQDAYRIASRRIRAHGVHPTVGSVLGDAALARRWGSALLFPISQVTARGLIRAIHPNSKESQDAR